MGNLHDAGQGDDSGFISGVFNYCDRWCERCRFRGRCRVYYDESRRMAQHLVEDVNPNDPEVLAQDVHDSVNAAAQMLQQMADELGVDLDELPPGDDLDDDPGSDWEDEPVAAPVPLFPAAPNRSRNHPLGEHTMRYSDGIRAMLGQVRQEILEIGEDVTRSIEDAPASERQPAVDRLLEVREACEVLGWFAFFIHTKAMRVLHGVERADAHRNPELAEITRDGARGTTKLLLESIDRCSASLWVLAEFHQPWMERALPLLADLDAARQELLTLVPDHARFHRPGFDG